MFMGKDRLGRLMLAARHQDQIQSWSWWKRWLHYLLVSWRCPACIYWRDEQRWQERKA